MDPSGPFISGHTALARRVNSRTTMEQRCELCGFEVLQEEVKADRGRLQAIVVEVGKDCELSDCTA